MENKLEKQVSISHIIDSSSPLGMLFDHGSDAVAAFLISIQVLKILHAPFWIQLLSLYVFIMSTYFCAMWSQYCVGFFKLTRINPVDEGLPIYAIFCLIGTQVDLKILRQQHIIGTYS
jgi:ethanolaminephosphotransferase